MEPPSSSPVRDKAGNPVEQKSVVIPSSPAKAQNRTGRISSTQKIRKPPTVTPRRLNKFFTPRNTASARGIRQSKAGRQLLDITRNGANTRSTAGPLTLGDDTAVADENELPFSRPLKRRKISTDLASSPPQSSPLKHVQTGGQIQIFEDFSDTDSLPELFEQLQPFPRPIRRLREPGAALRLVQRSFGGHDALSRHRRGPDHGADWRAETANFATIPDDMHAFRSTCLPFCTTACNTNSLVAVGDEEGSIRLVDSAQSAGFSKTHITFRVHRNAIMDLSFSPDDFLLATASGDQTARVVDMQTQQTLCILTGHKNSVKQVRFRPNEDNMITTSSRDGTVQLWDLRSGRQSAALTVRAGRRLLVDADGKVQPETRYGLGLDVGYGHRSSSRPFESEMKAELSITSFQHMPQGREHLLITSSEVDASIKVWDLRNAGRRNPVPLSSTPVPLAHTRSRNYGINTMVLSGDGGRLYTVCRDSTVYAYSTNQLVLGHAPEMSSNPGRRRMLKDPSAGVAPLYGFKHPSLRVGTFYIKAALRPAKDGNGEMLAVGSTDSNPILFPTDERHLPRGGRPLIEHPVDEEVDFADFDLPGLPSSRRSTPATTSSSNIVHDSNVFTQGTALIGAHSKEVTSLAWTNEGNLVSISDDFTARCWREDPARARDLRVDGEKSGGRWRSGWADVGAAWDEEEG